LVLRRRIVGLVSPLDEAASLVCQFSFHCMSLVLHLLDLEHLYLCIQYAWSNRNLGWDWLKLRVLRSTS
jgi:hypothetical protein